MSEIPPALTAEEWAAALDEGDDHDTVRRPDVEMWRWTDGEDPEISMKERNRGYAGVSSREDAHALAALCLHGQPFGFTREDVGECRSRAADYEAMYDANGDTWFRDAQSRWASLADRIEALLPPKEAMDPRDRCLHRTVERRGMLVYCYDCRGVVGIVEVHR